MDHAKKVVPEITDRQHCRIGHKQEKQILNICFLNLENAPVTMVFSTQGML